MSLGIQQGNPTGFDGFCSNDPAVKQPFPGPQEEPRCLLFEFYVQSMTARQKIAALQREAEAVRAVRKPKFSFALPKFRVAGRRKAPSA